MVRQDIEATKSIRTTTKYICLPSEVAHSGHPIGQPGVYAQKLHPSVSKKILDMVQAGITEVTEIKHALEYYIE